MTLEKFCQFALVCAVFIFCAAVGRTFDRPETDRYVRESQQYLNAHPVQHYTAPVNFWND